MNNQKFQPFSLPAPEERKSILCVGITPCLQRTIAFESVEMGEVNRSGAVRLGASGKATNVARVLRALDEPCLLLSFIGGETGRLFDASLATEGLPFMAVPTRAPVRICETVIERATGRVTELVEEMAPPSADEWALLEAEVEKHAREAGLVLFPGTLPPGADARQFGRLVAAAVRSGARVLLDTSGPALLEGVLNRPWGVKLNQKELESTLGTTIADETEAVAALQRFARDGLQCVGVTRGAKAAWWWDADAARAFELPRVQVASPIGSGDSVLAGLALGLNRGLSAADAFRLGLACGCANAETDWPGELNAERVGHWCEAIVERPLGVA